MIRSRRHRNQESCPDGRISYDLEPKPSHREPSLPSEPGEAIPPRPPRVVSGKTMAIHTCLAVSDLSLVKFKCYLRHKKSVYIRIYTRSCVSNDGIREVRPSICAALLQVHDFRRQRHGPLTLFSCG